MRLLAGPQLRLSLLIPVSPHLLTIHDPQTPHSHSGDPKAWPLQKPDLLHAMGLSVGHAPHILLDISCPHLPGPQDLPLLSAHPHPMALGPRHQPHLSGEVPCSWWDRGKDHPAQCHLFKTRSKKAARTAMGVDDIHPAIGPAYLGHQQESKLDSPRDPTSSAGTASTLEMEQELHYASLSFDRMNPQKVTYRTQ
ncbi:hypothetical protein HPG69_014030 [Diceros bicornis minor]|uniref:Uncharacterized protein n=1 Tax=Diceros bicornis minor TaxID=77932 RepID=A0A7J7EN98_DICBM|nr:hypothetical protein HPG69_014030 [Diceros bicornis minor]